MDRQTRIVVDQLAALSQTRQGRRVLLVLTVVAAIAWGGWFLYQQYHQRHLVTGPAVRLATWNLHEFAPRPQIDLRRIAEIIQSNHFDLLAIQEVRGAGEEVDALLNVLGPPWRATRYSPTSGNHERFAFLYNGDHIEELGPPQPVALAGSSVFARTPYEDTFRAGNFQFTIVTVHLEWTNKSLREQEGQALADLVPQTRIGFAPASPDHLRRLQRGALTRHPALPGVAGIRAADSPADEPLEHRRLRQLPGAFPRDDGMDWAGGRRGVRPDSTPSHDTKQLNPSATTAPPGPISRRICRRRRRLRRTSGSSDSRRGSFPLLSCGDDRGEPCELSKTRRNTKKRKEKETKNKDNQDSLPRS